MAELAMAPFMGLTHKDYRNAFASCFPGFDSFYAPFISGVNADKVSLSKFSDVLPINENTETTVPQFASISASEIIAICNTLGDEGYTHVNWNMGCPFARVAHKLKGCGILPYPGRIQKILDVVMPEINIKLSVKTRLGFLNDEELTYVVSVFNQFPLHRIIIHARNGKQLYSGETNTQKFQHYANLLTAPVIYNGDIFNKTRYNELISSLKGVSGWMVGRGALINPFLPSQIKGIAMDEDEKRTRINQFHEILLERIIKRVAGEKKALGQMKAVWYYMSGVFSGGKEVYNNLKKAQDKHSYLNFAGKLLQLPFATDAEIEDHWRKAIKHR